MREIGLISLFLFMSACGPRNTPVSVSAPSGSLPTFIDLQAGWRLRAIVPITKSGVFGSAVASVISRDSTNQTITVTAKSDFLGYETQYYSVAKQGRGIRIRFDSASSTKNGQTAAESQPSIDLFRLPARDRYVRLVYLLRASRADHNMAVIAARQIAKLESITQAVQHAPADCISSPQAFCSWIPAGIAVRPEMRQASGMASEWVPVR
jgi:hypothetical protein